MTHKLALIGNGPVSDEQRLEINSFDTVIRLARVNNYKLDDKMTHLCLDGLGLRKGNPRYKGLYLDTIVKNKAKYMVFLDKKWDFLIEQNKEMGFNGESIHFGIPNKGELIKKLQCQHLSLGLKGFLYAQTFGCPIHLFGFNWNPIMKKNGHNAEKEKEFILHHENVILHETPTSDLGHVIGEKVTLLTHTS
jgi:hypothetical protein